ncbi:MAG: hypothetical protein EOP04_13725 [Proteobacteria bacterium]|nr:MAG: hypothetical protein EOP04_13725 [Pseudomonadota bacterium]
MNRAYIFTTWIATVIGAPLLLAFYMTAFRRGHSVLDAWELFPFALFFGLFLSLPSLGVYLLVFELTRKRIKQPLHMRILLFAVTLLLIAVSFWILGGYLAVWLALAYTIAAAITVLAFGRRLSP